MLPSSTATTKFDAFCLNLENGQYKTWGQGDIISKEGNTGGRSLKALSGQP